MRRFPARRPAMSWEARLVLLSLAGGAPALVVALVLLPRGVALPFDRALAAFTLIALWLGCALALRGRVVRALQTIGNIVAALRERDYSIRPHGTDTRSALGLAHWELGALSEALRDQRLAAREATALLRHVMDSIDVALFGFGEDGRLALVNREGEALLGLPAERALGRDAGALGLADALGGETPRLVELRLPARAGRWELRRGDYRHEGRPHRLVALADLSRALREEEREAWMRLVRVLSHEINNSLAPVQSLAATLRALLERDVAEAAALAGTTPAAARAARDADLAEGLAVIEGRARSLGRFMSAYAKLARLPRPVRAPLDLGAAVRHAARLEPRLPVAVADGPPLTLRADAAQLEQMLINLVRNAADAALETGGGVRVTWSEREGAAEVRIEDDGPGLGDTSNLFVPFFTTKPEGSGIGLVLSRQIAEAHGGRLELTNRPGARGCVAVVRLPLDREAAASGARARLASSGGAALALALGIAGCATLQEVAAVRRLEFAFERVASVRLAGVALDGRTRLADLGAADAARLAAAVARREVPVELVAHVSARNPARNAVAARLVRVGWTLFVGERRTVGGTVEGERRIAPGESAEVPIAARFELFELAAGGGARDLFDLARAIAGHGPAPADVRLELAPTVETPLGPMRWPAPVVVRR